MSKTKETVEVVEVEMTENTVPNTEAAIEVIPPEKSWLHKKADAVAERCAEREQKKADRKAAKQAKKAEKEASGGLTTGQKILIGGGLALATFGTGLLLRKPAANGTAPSDYELAPGDVKVEPQVIGEGSPEPVEVPAEAKETEAHPEE